MYSNLTLFKQYLEIDANDTTNDVLLTTFLNSATDKINNLCGVDSFDEGVYVEDIDGRKVIETTRGFEIYLKNKPVQQIQTINGVEYTGVHGTDYMIIYDRRIILKSLSLNSFGFVKVGYKAGYNRNNEGVDELPDDLKLMEMMLASGMRQQHNYEGVSSYKLGDESITFGSKGEVSANDQYFTFTTLLNKYKNFILPV